MEEIFKRILEERKYQDEKWGVTDNENTPYHWAAYIGAYANRSLAGAPGDTEERRAAFKADMIKVAALAIAAVEKL